MANTRAQTAQVPASSPQWTSRHHASRRAEQRGRVHARVHAQRAANLASHAPAGPATPCAPARPPPTQHTPATQGGGTTAGMLFFNSLRPAARVGASPEASAIKFAHVCEHDRLGRHVEPRREGLGGNQHLQGPLSVLQAGADKQHQHSRGSLCSNVAPWRCGAGPGAAAPALGSPGSCSALATRTASPRARRSASKRATSALCWAGAVKRQAGSCLQQAFLEHDFDDFLQNGQQACITRRQNAQGGRCLGHQSQAGGQGATVLRSTACGASRR